MSKPQSCPADARDISISVVTATLNARAHLPGLIDSLKSQTDQRFGWVVFDGGSTDATADLLRQSGQALNLHLSIDRDFGIYDALNRALDHVHTDYYLVLGSDDRLSATAIADYRRVAIETNFPDIVAAAVWVGSRLRNPRHGWGWLMGMEGEASSHSVGLLIKRSLHDKFGMYSRMLPIAADQLFVKRALNGGASISRENFIAGTFATTGTSHSDDIGMLTEVFRVQLATERNLTLQYALFVLRVLRRLLRQILRASSRSAAKEM